MRKLGKGWSIAALTAAALFAGACGSESRSSSSGQTTATSAAGGSIAVITPTAAAQQQTIRRGGTLLVAMEVNPKDFDPMVSGDAYSSAVSSSVTEGLYKINDKIEPEPWLAEKVDISTDGLTYTFTMRRGVMFHDGTELDAEAVKFSIDRVRDEKNKKYPGYNDGQLISETTVVDKYTFKLVLKEPASPFPTRLTGRLGGIVSPKAVREMGDEQFNKTPVGTGPFKFKEFKSDTSVRVEKFDNYWRNGADGKKLPYLDAVEWRIITEPATRFTALQTGDVHISSIRDQDKPLAQADKNLDYAQQPGFAFTGFSFNIKDAPFDNKALRQAVQYALDRDEIVKAVFENNRVAGALPVPIPMEWAYDKNYKGYTFDLSKAKEKLKEGGKPDGFEFTAWIGSGSSVTRQLYDLMQVQLAKVGIKMKIEEGDFNGVVVKKWQNNDADGGTYGISWSTGVDPDGLLTNLFTKSGSFNFNKFDNAKVDELINQARRVSSKEERAKLYREMLPLLMEDSPYLVLCYGIERHVGQKKVQGWSLGPKATTSYSEYWLKE